MTARSGDRCSCNGTAAQSASPDAWASLATYRAYPGGFPSRTVLHIRATAEHLKAANVPGEPYEWYLAWFTDGHYSYELKAFAPFEEISEQQVIAAAKSLYKRVNGAPPPETPET